MTQILKSLSFAAVQVPTNSQLRNGKDKARMKFVTAVANQVAAAEAYIAGASIYTVPKKRYVSRDGERKREVVDVEVRPWWFQENGAYYVAPRYANKVLEIGGKGRGVVAAGDTLDDVQAVLLKLREAAECGELDKALEAVAAEARERLTRKK